MQHAFLAGTAIAAACGLAGFFVVRRAQVFAGDALSHVAFTGALAAAVAGLDVRAGLFAATILGGLVLGALGDRARSDDVVIGSVFAWTLGLGALFLSIYTTKSSGGNGTAGAAHSVTANPSRGLLLSAALAVASIWIGLTLSYVFPTLPPSSMIVAAAFGFYALAATTTVGDLRLLRALT